MFICDTCCKLRGVDAGIAAPTSLGTCEICNTTQPCADIHHSRIPPLPEPTHSQPDATTRDWKCPQCESRVNGIAYEQIVAVGVPTCAECDVEMEITHEPESQPITQERVDSYIRGGGVKCPYCGSANIEGDTFGAEAGGVWQKVYCSDCERQWAVGYTLDNFSNGHEIDFQVTPDQDPVRAAMGFLLLDCLGLLRDTASWLSVKYNGQHGIEAINAGERQGRMDALVARIRNIPNEKASS